MMLGGAGAAASETITDDVWHGFYYQRGEGLRESKSTINMAWVLLAVRVRVRVIFKHSFKNEN